MMARVFVAGLARGSSINEPKVAAHLTGYATLRWPWGGNRQWLTAISASALLLIRGTITPCAPRLQEGGRQESRHKADETLGAANSACTDA
jgi:hypothetical protein